MLKAIKFGWYCIRHAWRGCWTRANELGAVLGGVLLASAIWLCSPYLRERDLIEAPTTYWGVAGLTALMAVCSVILAFLVIFIARLLLAPARLYWEQRSRAETLEAEKLEAERTDSEFAGDIPDVKIADDPVAWRLFETKERDTLLPLLEGGQLQAWGRLGSGNPSPIKISSDKWTTNYLDRRPADSPGRINQTYLRPRARPYEHTYHDVYLNRAQLKRKWPKLWDPISLYEAASLAYGETRNTVISGMAECRSDSPLFWYVFHFFVVSEIPVYGNIKFATKRERVPTINGYTPELRDNDQIILKDIYGNKDWENLTVEPEDLIKDFESLRKTAAEVPG